MKDTSTPNFSMSPKGCSSLVFLPTSRCCFSRCFLIIISNFVKMPIRIFHAPGVESASTTLRYHNWTWRPTCFQPLLD
ncbi:hypothetical protein I7I53_06666 [Histoplasma capsulatum var. duboisii H88]|uniref:Uncharacterized protein n=1 Tax=Ajellomyces capsulatus (strain H88) TaxID=544711 RepID=A0A8A1LCM9_AJEC8|nr:hypothetical protein I7I53_06666 [Histoplasma capsulatum var. duboisii H88]